ncbi:ABC transporter permease subunit [Brachybacterium sp. J144]|uniref:ABC transporter permease n=1 Tax=Brachybacterium sp. J144 TaxID=3116487 RepID=UPI002E787F27|nr:ABC transporter permease subunit [Brachybacterium sp. J144]MEE1650692.1 ABC transporter permease subunit [Brachybacterium sp. J144]
MSQPQNPQQPAQQPAAPHPSAQQPSAPHPAAAHPSAPQPHAAPTAPRNAPLNGTLSLRLRGLRLVTSLELRQRIRSRKWYVALGVWTLILLGLGGVALVPTMLSSGWSEVRWIASITFSLQAMLVLAAMLLVVPALSAGSLNGDRSAGTLAILQASLVSPLEIVLGKLIAGWVTGLAFLVLALPSVLPTMLLGGIAPLYALRLVVVIALLTLCVTAVGLGLSAITQRQLGSVVLAYVIVFGVTAVLPIVWGTSAAVLAEERTVTTWTYDYENWPEDGSSPAEMQCIEQEEERTVLRLDLTMPLMWGNPVVLLAEAAPTLGTDWWNDEADGSRADVLTLTKLGMRTAATPLHPSHFVSCSSDTPGYPTDLGSAQNRPLWPMGFGLWILAAAASLTVAVLRLRVPIRHLGAGTRIA